MALTDFQQAWVAALRSGKYEQGQSVLRTLDNKFCCLGVAYDVEGVEWAEGREEYRAEGGMNFPTGRALARWGLSIPVATALSDMNDGWHHKHPDGDECSARHTFAEIADYLESIL